MKILNLSKKTGEAKIRINSIEDIHSISKIIKVGDKIIGKTERKIKLGGSESRQKTVRKTITLEIQVTKVVQADEVIRVQGKVTLPQEGIPINSAHTIELKQDSEVKIKKTNWYKYELEQLKQAEKNSQIPKLLVCVLDDEQANFGYISSSGVKPLGKINLRLTKKRLAEKKQNDIQKVAKEIISKAKNTKIIIASPLFWKDLVIKEVVELNPELSKQIIAGNVSTGSKKGLAELITSGELDNMLKGATIAQHEKLIEKLLKGIAKNTKVAYGLKEVNKSAEAGAVTSLMIAEKLMFKPEIISLIKKVESTNGDVHILDNKSDAGKKLIGLSGIAAILKFKIN